MPWLGKCLTIEQILLVEINLRQVLFAELNLYSTGGTGGVSSTIMSEWKPQRFRGFKKCHVRRNLAALSL
jgi:hypothetical protein